jgi:hypothetical protein
MTRSFLIAPILCMAFALHSCSTLEYADGSSKDEIEKSKSSKDEMWEKLKRARSENIQLKSQIDVLQAQNKRIRDENKIKIELMKDQTESLDKQIVTLKEENKRLTDENQALLEKIAIHQDESGTPASKSYSLEKCLQGLKIKVLSGDGDLSSAREMSKRLREKGCAIEAIGYAPRSNFSYNTVYSKPECQEQAKRLVSFIGGGTIYKPLTWASVFDIIVVTGNNP